jgi:hypothetical protein
MRMHITFLLEERIVNRARKTAESMGKNLEGFLLDEIQKLANAASEDASADTFEQRPGVGSVSIRRTVREETYRMD